MQKSLLAIVHLSAVYKLLKMSLMTYTELSSGYRMPLIGLGTWQASSKEVGTAVGAALDSGYRHIDTAFNYNNEETVGVAVRKWLEANNTKREDIFITTKLPVFGNRASDVSKYLSTSLSRLGLEYVDLYLIHMPFTVAADETGEAPAKQADGNVVIEESDHLAVWKAMEAEVERGRIRSLGVSNFNEHQLERLYKAATIKPANLQIELHAALQQLRLRSVCSRLSMAVTAYSPLGSPGSKQHFQNKYQISNIQLPDLLTNSTVLALATSYSKNPSQILLRHLIQQGIAAIPKSTNPERIAQNLQIFDFNLREDDMETLNRLDKGEAGRILNFLFLKGIENHLEYPFDINGDSTECCGKCKPVASAMSTSGDKSPYDTI